MPAEIVTLGTPEELIGAKQTNEIRYRENGEVVVLDTENRRKCSQELTARAAGAGRELEALEVRRPTLEDVYLELIGAEPEASEE